MTDASVTASLGAMEEILDLAQGTNPRRLNDPPHFE